jgi:hypothetical protein
MVGGDMDRIYSLRPYVEHVAHISGKTVKLVKFTNREELEVIKP